MRRLIPGATLSDVRRAERQLRTRRLVAGPAPAGERGARRARAEEDEVESERKRRWLRPTGLAGQMGGAMEPRGDSSSSSRRRRHAN